MQITSGPAMLPPARKSKILSEGPEFALSEFRRIAIRDIGDATDLFARWLFTDRKLAAGQLTDMQFYEFVGVGHLPKFFRYIKGFRYPNYLDGNDTANLQEIAAQNDLAVFSRLGIKADATAVRHIGLYNAQDYIFQRAYATPDRQKPVRMLDFGAGHGRMANLAFSAPSSKIQKYFAVDGIPASYLTQNLYYSALGLRVFEYLEHHEESFESLPIDDFDVFHFPTWKMSALPANYFDLICCVQVLREISKELLFYVLEEFRRILKPGGAIYIRDHLALHNPNNMSQDQLLEANGFQIEFYPRVTDYTDVHGVPRIWRKFDSTIFSGNHSLTK